MPILPHLFKVNELGSKLLLLFSNSYFLIYDIKFFRLKIIAKIKNKCFAEIVSIKGFTEELIFLFTSTGKVLLYNYIFHKYIYVIEHPTIRLNFFNFTFNLFFFQQNKQMLVLMNFQFLNAYFLEMFLLKSNCQLIKKKKNFFLLNSNSKYRIQNELLCKKKSKNAYYFYGYFSNLLLEEIIPNLFNCWDLSSKRVIFELFIVNQKKNIIFFHKTKNVSKEMEQNYYDNEKHEKMKYKVGKPKDMTFFPYFSMFTDVLKKMKTQISWEVLNTSILAWIPFSFFAVSKTSKCYGFELWGERIFENWSYFISSFREIDFTSMNGKKMSTNALFFKNWRCLSEGQRYVN